MMMNYIKTYDNVLPKDICGKIIDKFEKQSSHHVNTVLDNHRSFTEINLNLYKEWSNEVNNLLVPIMQTYIEKYKRDNDIDEKIWPVKYGFEQIRMKRYLPNDVDEFQFHVDVTDHPSARRFLVYFFYLNDVQEGGETGFQYNRSLPIEQKIKPEAGKLLMFPPMWTHPHIGFKPISEPKYIIGSYLHYL